MGPFWTKCCWKSVSGLSPQFHPRGQSRVVRGESSSVFLSRDRKFWLAQISCFARRNLVAVWVWNCVVLRLFGNLVTTRLLAPEVFGIMAIATTVQVVISLMGDIGLRQTAIQSRNGDDQTFLNTAWSIQALRGGLIWLVCACFAAGLSVANSTGWLPANSVYGDPSLPSILVATSFSSVVLGFQSMKIVSRSRDLDLQRITLIELIQMLVVLTVAIALGWLTHSIWSFVASGLAGSAVTTILSHVWLPGSNDRFAWDRTALNEIVRFGRWVFISSIIGVFAMNGDRLLLAGWVTATILGYYSIASNLCSFVDGIGGRIFSGVSLPALSEVARKQPERFSEVFWRMRWGADCSYVALAGFLFATGELIIQHLYDARYLPAGAMLQLLSFGLLFSRYGLAQSAYVAREGKTTWPLSILPSWFRFSCWCPRRSTFLGRKVRYSASHSIFCPLCQLSGGSIAG